MAKKVENPSGKQRDFVPQELVMGIVARLPPKSLARFRCVNRSLCSCLTDHRFLTKLAIQHTVNPVNHKIFCWSRACLHKINIQENQKILCSNQDLEIMFEHPILWNDRARSIGTCHGLLCLGYYRTEFILFNPLTRDGRKLSRRRWLKDYMDVFYGFGYDSWNEDYKIVRIEDGSDEKDDRDVIDIFSVKNNSWKTLRLHPPARIGEPISAIYVTGVLHWQRGNYNDRIVCFHLGDEKFGEILVPRREDIDASRRITISVLKGCLCMSQTNNSSYLVWVMKEYGVEDSWTNIFRIDKVMLLSDEMEIFRLKQGDRPLCYTNDGRLLILGSDSNRIRNKILLYHSKDKSVYTVSIVSYSHCVACLESLVSPYSFSISGREEDQSQFISLSRLID